jgi:hypothetical protein
MPPQETEIMPKPTPNPSAPVRFALKPDTLPQWRHWLAQHHIRIEDRISWPRSTTLYLHDPEGHLLKVLSPGLWNS